jgi:lauroyl/myristoyl acyltransferase
MPDQPEPAVSAVAASWPDLLRNWVLRGIYRFGWQLAARLPPRFVAMIISAASWVALRNDGLHVRTLRRNLALTTGAPVRNDLVQAALKSYLRTFYEVLALPAWSDAKISRRVIAINERVVREAFAGPGAVVALPHSANWDLAGAWACATGMPVTTVAEQLSDAEYAAFVAFRERLGLQVVSHQDPGALTALLDAIRCRRVVCLLADRDLPGTGVPVSWRGHPITMPAGPAMVARRTGAALLPAVCQFTKEGMAIVIGEPIEPRPGREGLAAMMQDVADFFTVTIARQPEDWHMMQPFFPDRQPAKEET